MPSDKHTGNPSTYSLRASTIARVHTVLSFGAFAAAFLIGCALHYKKIVKNGVAGWPQEWFPSVSATIGDWYPERNIFQILIALTSGPRFAVVLFSYFLNHAKAPSSSLPTFILATGVIRTLSCGGWVYITSSDDHDVHDVLMIFYIICNIPWMYGGIKVASASTQRRRTAIASAFWVALMPMIYFFIQHKVHRIPGAYTHYSFFEWSLILLDILFDTMTEIEFRESGVEIVITLPQHGSAERVDYEIKTSVSVKPSVTNGVAPAKVINKDSATASATSYVPALENDSDASILSACRPTLSFLADVYFSYQTWTLVTALPTTLFYFSVWKLALAGPEFSTLATLAPCVLGFPAVLNFARSKYGRAFLSAVGAVAGIGCWRAESVWTRLGGVVVGVMAGLMRWGAEWEEGQAYHGVVFVLGLMVSSLSKHLNHGNNPAWPIVDENTGGRQLPILTLSVLALHELITRPESSPSPASLSAPDKIADPSATGSSKSHAQAQVAASTSSTNPWLPPSVALGVLIYSFHERLTDASTLVAWSWTGYPLTGPSPHVHAPLTLVAQSLGVLLALAFLHAPPSPSQTPATNLLEHPLWYTVGAASTYILYTYKDWPGYCGALVHAMFLTSITPQVLRNVAAVTKGSDGAGGKRAGRVVTTVWLIWIIFLFMGTFTAAYAFVPGAGPFREHTDYLLAAQIALLAPSFRWRSISSTFHHLPCSAFTLPRTLRTHALSLLALIPLVALLSPLTRPPSPPPAPSAAHERGRLLNAGIWTVHFGIDAAGRDNQRRMRDLVRDMDLDVFGLLETDLHRPVFGNRDLTRVISEELGYYVDIGPGPNQHTWGAALFSKFPILKSTHHLLPSPDGELAPAIEAILDIYGVNVTVIVSHNGQEETPLDRELQATELARIMAASYPDPVIFLGYVVTKPKAPRPAPYLIIAQDGLVHDIDEEDNDRWCEYIMYRGLYRTAYARVSRSTVTDTELQIGQFVVPRYGKPVTNDTHEARYLRSWKEDLPEEHWFPMEYYGNEHEGGVRGHFYHVFNTPLYYNTAL